MVKFKGDPKGAQDWRQDGTITEVVDQGDCNSSWAFMTTEVVSSLNKIQGGNLDSLSAQQLIDCASDYGAQMCGGGYIYSGFQYYLDNDNNKPVSATDYPYTGVPAKSCSQSDNSATDFEISDWRYLQPYDLKQMKLAIDQQPIGASVGAECDVFQFYESGVFNGTWTEIIDDTQDPPVEITHNCPNSPQDLDHAVVVVGYGHDVDLNEYFILKNTWGLEWGDKGFMFINATERSDSLSVAGIFNQAVIVNSGAISTIAASFGLLAAAAVYF